MIDLMSLAYYLVVNQGCYFRIFLLIDNRMGIKRLLIDSRIQGGWTVWYGHTKTGPDRRRDREEGAATGHAGGCRVRDASLQQHVQWFNDCCSSQCVDWARWVVTPMTLWVVRPLHWCRSRYADVTADDWQASWLSQGVQKSIVNLSAACINSSHPPDHPRRD